VLLSEMVSAGEVHVSLTNYASNADSMKRKAKPIDWKPVEPVIGRPQAIGLAANAPHPNAALLFADFVLSPEASGFSIPWGVSLEPEGEERPDRLSLPDARSHRPDRRDEKWLKLWNELVTVK